jgi:hypothetical protein
MNEDFVCDNKYYWKKFNLEKLISMKDFNKSEIFLLKSLEFSVFISDEKFNNFIEVNSKILKKNIIEGIYKTHQYRKKILIIENSKMVV